MNTAKEFLKQYAKGKPIEMMISDGGGELPNNTDHIASAMQAYKEHCNKSQEYDSLQPVSGSLPLTFEQCLREEFLINTQNYPKEYHNLFNQKFNRAIKRFEEK